MLKLEKKKQKQKKRPPLTELFKQKKPHVVDPELAPLMYCEIRASLEKYSAVDICLICDITGSMEKYIIKIREILGKFISNVQNLTSTCPRIAFIGFRDKYTKANLEVMKILSTEFDNQSHGSEHLITKQFSTNLDEMLQYLKDIKCYGGADFCEDLVKPLKSALKLDWKSDLLYAFLLLDAPTHGSKYHDKEYSDDFPKDDKKELLEKLMCHYRNCKINLIIIKCNNSVNKMIEIMKKYYSSYMNDLIVVDLSQVTDFMTESFANNFRLNLSKAFSKSLFQNFRQIKRAIQPENINDTLRLGIKLKFKGEMYNGKLSNLLYDQLIYNYKFEVCPSITTDCEISGDMINQGMFKECYYLDIKDNGQYVSKISKIPIAGPEELYPDIEGNAFADHFSIAFNNLIKAKIITVLPLAIIKILNKQDEKIFMKSKAILAQKFLKGLYVKFNNNYGWVMKADTIENDAAQAFSHFTYEYSMGTLIVVDIQGVVNVKEKKQNKSTEKTKDGDEEESDEEDPHLTITDPAIHSQLYKGHFGETNHGKLGIIKFFQTHKCNDYCKKLGLLNYQTLENDRLSKIMAEHQADKNLNHLYEKFDEKISKWQEEIRNFDKHIKPAIASGKPKEVVMEGFAVITGIKEEIEEEKDNS